MQHAPSNAQGVCPRDAISGAVEKTVHSRAVQIKPVHAESRVIAYVDGFNLYFGMKSSGLSAGYWLNIPLLLTRYLLPSERLVLTKYFTSRISGPSDKVARQNEYLDALQTLPALTMFFGQYQLLPRKCDACEHRWLLPSEKMTDVNIAVELLRDAVTDGFDTAVLVSADSDLAAPIRALRDLWPHKRVVVVFPPRRGSVVLQSLAHEKRKIRGPAILSCQLPDEVIGADGYPRRRPAEWRANEPNPEG